MKNQRIPNHSPYTMNCIITNNKIAEDLQRLNLSVIFELINKIKLSDKDSIKQLERWEYSLLIVMRYQLYWRNQTCLTIHD